MVLAPSTHAKYVQHPAGHASIQLLTLDRYSHLMPSMDRNTAKGKSVGLGDLLWPFPSSRWWVGAQPKRDVGRLHRLRDHSHQIVPQGIQVRPNPWPAHYEFACAHPSPSLCVRKLRLFMRFSMIFRSRFVHCVPVRISPVAVRVAVS